jgi:hypothetical protein
MTAAAFAPQVAMHAVIWQWINMAGSAISAKVTKVHTPNDVPAPVAVTVVARHVGFCNLERMRKSNSTYAH